MHELIEDLVGLLNQLSHNTLTFLLVDHYVGSSYIDLPIELKHP